MIYISWLAKYQNKIDILITVGELAKDIAKKSMENGLKAENVFVCTNNSEAVKNIKMQANKGDAVLIKASNGLNFQEIFDNIF